MQPYNGNTVCSLSRSLLVARTFHQRTLNTLRLIQNSSESKNFTLSALFYNYSYIFCFDCNRIFFMSPVHELVIITQGRSPQKKSPVTANLKWFSISSYCALIYTLILVVLSLILGVSCWCADLSRIILIYTTTKLKQNTRIFQSTQHPPMQHIVLQCTFLRFEVTLSTLTDRRQGQFSRPESAFYLQR